MASHAMPTDCGVMGRGRYRYARLLIDRASSAADASVIGDADEADLEQAAALFAKFDARRTGRLNFNQFQQLLRDAEENRGMRTGARLDSVQGMKALFGAVDLNGDGRIDFNELLSWQLQRYRRERRRGAGASRGASVGG